MCWLVNLERKSLKIETMEYKKYSSFTFIDPMKHLFGFTINPPKKNNTSPNSSVHAPQSPTLAKKELDLLRPKKVLENVRKTEL